MNTPSQPNLSAPILHRMSVNNAPPSPISSSSSSSTPHPTTSGGSADKPEYPWKHTLPSTLEYPDLVTLRLVIHKEHAKVPEVLWPWKRSESGKYLNIDYFKHLGYGQPPATLPGNQGDLFIDFTTPELPLIYFYNNRWLPYNGESVVLRGDSKEWLGILEHPLFPDRYLWSGEKKGIYWTGDTVFKGSSLACLNDYRGETDQWRPKYLCDANQMLALGSRWDFARLPNADPSKTATELSRRSHVRKSNASTLPEHSHPLPSSSNPPHGTSTSPQQIIYKRLKMKPRHLVPKGSKPSPKEFILPRIPASAPFRGVGRDPRRESPTLPDSSHRAMPNNSTCDALSSSHSPPPVLPPSAPRSAQLTTASPEIADFDMQEVEPPSTVQNSETGGPKIDMEAALARRGQNLEDTVHRLEYLLEERKRNHQKHIESLRMIQKLKRELKQSDEARVFAEQRAAFAEQEFEAAEQRREAAEKRAAKAENELEIMKAEGLMRHQR